MKRIAFLVLTVLITITLFLPSGLTAGDEPVMTRDPEYSAVDGSPIMYENRKVADVEESFYNLARRGEWMGFYLGTDPALSNQLELFPPPFASHIQGMARSPRVGQAPVFYMAVSGTPEDENSYAALLVVEMGSRPYHGERLGSNRLQQGKETTSTFPDPGLGRDRVVKIIEYPYQKHPSGIAMVGDILAVPNGGASEVRGDVGEIRVMFYDCSDPLNPVEMPEYELLLKAGSDVPKLFTLPTEFTVDLEDHKIVTDNLVLDFLQAGDIVLSSEATIKRYGNNIWLITDNDYDRKYSVHLEKEAGEFFLNVYHAWEKPLIIGLEHEGDLNNETLTGSLRDALSTVHVHVGDDALIMSTGDDVWFVEDDNAAGEDIVYTIQKKGNYLHIYGAPAKPPWTGGGQGVGITKLPPTDDYPEGRFLLVRNTGQEAHFHWSNQGTFADGLMWTDYQELTTEATWDFTTVPPTPLPDLQELLNQGYWQDSKPRFQNLTFVDQEVNDDHPHGGLYLIGALNTDQNSPTITFFGEDKLYLIKLQNQDQPGSLTMTAALDAKKELLSPGKARTSIWPYNLWEDRWYAFAENWFTISIPEELHFLLNPLNLFPDIPDLTVEATKPMSKRTQANFTAGATAYVTPSGELLYYGVHHWADGNPGNGWKPWTLHGPDEFESQDFVKMAELSHKEVSAAGTCGEPLFREDHLGGPYKVQDPSQGVDLYGEVYDVEPWVKMFEDDDYRGHTVMVDYDTQNDDDYDLFKYLDGAFNECRDRLYYDTRGGWDGFSNCMSSYRWCGPAGSTLTFYDNAQRRPCSKSSCKDDLVRNGDGHVFEESLKGKSFKEEADSVLLEWTGPDENYAWDLTGDGLIVDDCQNPVLKHYYPGLDSETDTVQLTYTRDGSTHVFTTEVTSDPPDPGFVYLRFDNRCPESGQQINLDGAWNITASEPITPTVTIDWGDSNIMEVESSVTDGHMDPYRGTFAFSHNYASHGTYTVEVCAEWEAEGELYDFCDDDFFEIKRSPFALLPRRDRDIDEGEMVMGLLAKHYEGYANVAKTIVDWGDNTEEEVVDHIPILDQDGKIIGGRIEGEHTYADDGIYRVVPCVVLEDESTYCTTFVTTVGNVAPMALEAGPDRTIDEGAHLQVGPLSITDPGFDCVDCDPQTIESFTAAIDWGDGTTEPLEDVVINKTAGSAGVATTADVTAYHHYADNGIYDVSICVYDDDQGEICDGFAVNVLNVEPSVDAGLDQLIFEGDLLQLDPATFSDPGFDCLDCQTVEEFTAVIDWGDGSPSDTSAVVAETPGREGVLTAGTISASHQYLVPPGDYMLTVCVIDDDNAETCDSLVVTVVHRLMKFCAYANEKDVQMEESSKLACSIGSMGKIELKKMSEVTGAIEGAHDVKLGEQSKVGGTVYAAGKVEIKDGVIVAGGVVEHADILYVTQVDLAVQAGGSDKTVSKGGTMDLAPGSYGKLIVKESGTLQLSDGRYFFESVKIEKKARIAFTIPEEKWTIIEIEKNLEIQKSAEMVTISGDAQDILFKIGGGRVKLGKNALLLGTFIAPYASVDVEEGAKLSGVLYAEKVQIKKSVDVSHTPALDPFIKDFLP